VHFLIIDYIKASI